MLKTDLTTDWSVRWANYDGNAFRLFEGELEAAPINEDDTIDTESVCTVDFESAEDPEFLHAVELILFLTAKMEEVAYVGESAQRFEGRHVHEARNIARDALEVIEEAAS